MSGKKQGSTWYDCSKCGQRLLKVFTTKHDDLGCGAIFPIIENGAVITPIAKVPVTSKIQKLPFIESHLSSSLIFLSDAIFQECGFETFSWVYVKGTCAGPEDAEIWSDTAGVALQVWPISEQTAVNSPHALLTGNGVLVNNIRVLNATYCIQKIPSRRIFPADVVRVKLRSDQRIDCKDFSARLRRKMKNRVLVEGSQFRIRYFTETLLFSVVSVSGSGRVISEDDNELVVKKMMNLSCQDLNAQDIKFFEVVNSTVFQVTLECATEIGKSVQKWLPTLNDVGGLDSCISELRSFVEYAITDPGAPHGVLLHGQHGTGKTSLVEAFCNSRNLHAVIFKEFSLPDEIGLEAFRSYTTATTLDEAITKAIASQPAAIVMENLETIVPTNSSSRASAGYTNITGNLRSILTSLKGSKTVVIATSSNIDNVNLELRTANAFGKEIELPVPSVVQRKGICSKLLNRTRHALTEEDINSLAVSTHGFVGADLRGLISQAALLANLHSISKPETVPFNASHVLSAMKSVRPSAMKSILIEVPNVRWEDIGGQKELKLKLKQVIEWPLKHPDAFLRMGISPPKGILMYGPPGCSKTMIARAIATESGLNFISVKSSDLFSKWVGESEKAVQKIFRTARQVAPCIVFFDEIDSLGGERSGSSGSSNVHERVLSQLLVEIDGVEPLKEVTIVAATNRPDIIDQALLRPGRLDRIIYVSLPDEEARKEIFKIWFRKMPVESGNFLDDLVRLTEGYSGAEVTAVCHEAALNALDESIGASIIQQSHFHSALKTVRPRISKEQIQFYETYLESSKTSR